MSLTLGPLTFHVYGFILGVAIVATIFWAEYISKQERINQNQFWQHVYVAVLGGVIGARLYHVMTDWQIYVASPFRVLHIWQGGLSIIGAVIGAALAVGLLAKKQKQRSAIVWFDIAALSIPVGQIIGRLGNFVNQELYGLPTQLPWGIPIDPSNRIIGYEQYTHFHPLFAYEMIGVAIIFWFLWRKYHEGVKIGSGKLIALYIIFYSVLRISLDFFRIGNILIPEWGIGVNQLVLFGVTLWTAHWMLKSVKKTIVFAGLMLVLFVGIFQIARFSTATDSSSTVISNTSAKTATFQTVMVGDQKLKVEIAETNQEITHGLSDRTEIGSDGMLFLFGVPQSVSFWMKDMHFDLDFVWIYQDHIIGIEANVPAPKYLQALPIYPSPAQVTAVLEVPAGYAAAHNWQVGTKVIPFQNSP